MTKVSTEKYPFRCRSLTGSEEGEPDRQAMRGWCHDKHCMIEIMQSKKREIKWSETYCFSKEEVAAAFAAHFHVEAFDARRKD